jgi:hypothetical protein
MAISKKMLAVVVVLVVVVVAIAAAALSGSGAAKDNNPAARTAENSNMKVVVTDVIIGTNTTVGTQEVFLPLDAGEHFVLVKFNLTNKMSSSGSAPALFWKLYTSDGQISTVSFMTGNTVPDGVQGGATASFIIPFEVADGATPTKLVYNGLTDLEITL